MKKLWSFIKTAVLGGVIVILPAAILYLVFQWLFRLVANMVHPLSNLLAQWFESILDNIPFGQLQGIISEVLAIIIILTFCFAVGVAVKTRLGGWLFHTVESSVLRVAPGYKTVKEIVMQLFGSKKTPFSRVALVRLFGDTLVTTFVTDEHPDGSLTVFMPTAPNPTSGWIFHVKPEDIHVVDVTVENAMRTVIGCGVGSQSLLDAIQSQNKPDPSKNTQNT